MYPSVIRGTLTHFVTVYASSIFRNLLSLDLAGTTVLLSKISLLACYDSGQ